LYIFFLIKILWIKQLLSHTHLFIYSTYQGFIYYNIWNKYIYMCSRVFFYWDCSDLLYFCGVFFLVLFHFIVYNYISIYDLETQDRSITSLLHLLHNSDDTGLRNMYPLVYRLFSIATTLQQRLREFFHRWRWLRPVTEAASR
jgi:hypothetical protein